MGQLAQQTETIASTTYTTSYTYDRQGNQSGITNPDNSQIQYAYGTAGLVTNVSQKSNGGSFATVASSFDYSPTDQPTTITYPNGVTLTSIYDPTQLYRLVNKVATDDGSGAPQNLQALSEKNGGTSTSTNIGSVATGTAIAIKPDFFISSTTVIESYTGSVASFTVPAGVTQLWITPYGAEGGLYTGNPATPGYGGSATGLLSVTPSSTYYYCVGQVGGNNGSNTNAFCGGGAALPTTYGGGGGMTWFGTSSTFSTSSVIIVGGGGGGAAWSSAYTGGNGGGLTGTAGIDVGYSGGQGGTQTAGGAAGYNSGCDGGSNPTPGSAGQGGNSGSARGGGGGGGYYGGGGGGDDCAYGGGGGGGSSYMSSILTNTSTVSGNNTGNGSLVIVEETEEPNISSLNQYQADGVTPINEGSSTRQTPVILAAMLNSSTSTLQLQAEVEPAGTSFANVANVTSSPFVALNSIATTSFSGPNGPYHWQARAVDAQGNTSTWALFGPSASSTDFVIQHYTPAVAFTFPTNGTTTPVFPNWLLNATSVSPTDSYQLQVAWGITQPNQMENSINASGSQLSAGVSVPKTLYSGDYSDTGSPVNMVASATLYDLTTSSTLVATTTVSFTEITSSTAPSCGAAQIECVSYSYDANGNITKVVDSSDNNAAITVNYAYDPLNRLVTASSSNAASGINYLQTFAYNPLGDITSGPAGTYAYSSSGYVDSDAVTSIASTTFAYDNDGNFLSSGNATNTWNYRNQLTQSVNGSGSSTYAYDYQGNRVKLVQGTATTVFPTKFYNVMLGGAATSTEHIFANGLLLATVINATSTGGGTSAITLDATSTGTATAKSLATSTITVGSGSNELLIISIANGNTAATTTAVTVDGVAATPVVLSRSTNRNSSLWYVKGLSAGAHAISSTYSGSNQISLAAASFFGVSQTSPIDATSTLAITSSTVSSTLTTSVPGDLIIDALDSAVNQTSTAIGPNQAYIMKNLFETNNIGNASYQIATSSGAKTESYRMSASVAFSFSVAAFKAATSSGGTATSSAIRYALGDVLNNSNVVTDASGTIVETLDYYPYGQPRMDTTVGNFSGEKRKFIREEYDSGSGLNYLNARFYNGSQGDFLSEDPIFLSMGSVSTTQQSVQSALSDPQSLNSYSYASDNPVSESDPTGKCPWCITAAIGAATAVTGQFAFDMFTNVQTSGLNVGAYRFSSPETYFTRAVQGAIIGGTGGLIGGLAGVGIAGQMAIQAVYQVLLVSLAMRTSTSPLLFRPSLLIRLLEHSDSELRQKFQMRKDLSKAPLDLG